ncbi:MAG: NERD domain-containing protein [Kiritimatiellae bacterium]|nr:NERD domain-containing protein [Kiritimatiellia bacterium]
MARRNRRKTDYEVARLIFILFVIGAIYCSTAGKFIDWVNIFKVIKVICDVVIGCIVVTLGVLFLRWRFSGKRRTIPPLSHRGVPVPRSGSSESASSGWGGGVVDNGSESAVRPRYCGYAASAGRFDVDIKAWSGPRDAAEEIGRAGEIRLSRLLAAELGDFNYQIVDNVYLPLNDGTTTQIDHIVVSKFGVFVVETKNYKGWIFGVRDSKVWTQSLSGRRGRSVKHVFQNPLHQNYKHLCALEEQVGIPRSAMKAVIAFSDDVKFKTEIPAEVRHFSGVASYIKSFQIQAIKDSQIDEIVSTLRDWDASVSDRQRSKHVANLRMKHAKFGISECKKFAPNGNPLCPVCGSVMVSRRRKDGCGDFWGCSSYPRCHCIVNEE